MRDAFSDCHPTVNFLFYISALVMSMCFRHPAFLACSFVCSLAYYGLVKKGVLRYMAGMLGLMLVFTLINPLINTQGERVLFIWWRDRPYTLEALFYGLALVTMCVSVITWFATYNQVMTSDKFLYCFGKLAPSVSLILTMTLRLVPTFQKKTEQIGGARKCIGKSPEDGTVMEKAEHGLMIVSSLTSWALEGGVIMADSMRSRGFGCGERTSFSIYYMRRTDRRLLGLMTAAICLIMICAIRGGMYVTYTPQLCVSGMESIWTILGVISYFAFLSIPTAMRLMEEVTWHILRSKI